MFVVTTSHPGKAEVRIYDYVDDRVPVLARMYGRRLAGYRSIGYEPEAVLQSQGARDPGGGTAGYEV
jgi:hypothetical protein